MRRRMLFIMIILCFITVGFNNKMIINNRLKDNSKLSKINQHTGNTSGNISNEGLVASQGDWIYFDMFNKGLWKMKKDGSHKTKIVSDLAYYINVTPDYIYYCNHNERDTLFRIKLNGSSRQMLNLNYAHIGYVRIVGDWIYYLNYSNNYDICKMNLKHLNKITIYHNNNYIPYMLAEGDWVYFVEWKDKYSCLCKMRTDGTKKIIISKYPNIYASNFQSLCIQDGWIYYIGVGDDGKSNNEIYKIREDGTQKTLVVKERTNIRKININKDYIYFLTGSLFDSSISRIRINGKDQKKLRNIKYFTDINIINDTIYGNYYEYQVDPKGITYKMNLDGTNFSYIVKPPYPQ
jgi:hypothetical protein